MPRRFGRRSSACWPAIREAARGVAGEMAVMPDFDAAVEALLSPVRAGA
jgi:hypothetical protein